MDQVHTHTHTNLDLANIVGRTGFDFENFAFLGLFGSQITRPGLGQAVAVKDSTYEERLKDGEGFNKWSRTKRAINIFPRKLKITMGVHGYLNMSVCGFQVSMFGLL